ncbi:MAG: hypothetical protein MI750_14850, partial [Xanthomonadales bacterium]|nr:hypothetical protein [Xanthomonadales bacterium]
EAALAVTPLSAEQLRRHEARARLVSQVNGGTEYTPETEAIVRRNLRVIEQAMQEIHEAIEEDPNNPNLRELLTTIYQKESLLVDNAQRIEAESSQRTGI